MQQYIQCILAAFCISLSGSLPFGNLNLAAMAIAASENIRKAIWFASGIVLVEISYLGFTLAALAWVEGHAKLLLYSQWATVILLLLLCMGSIVAAVKKDGTGKNIFIENQTNRFVLGAVMSAVNPLQVPFWAGWGTWLFSSQIMEPTVVSYIVFTLSAGTGTFTAMLLYIFAGRKLSRFFIKQQRQVHIAMAILFFIMAILLVAKLFGK